MKKTLIIFFLNKMSKTYSIPSLNLQSKKKFKDYSVGIEKDTHKIANRQNQINNHGKNKPAYKFYIESVPKDKRKCYHPKTPRANQVCSKRNFDGQIKQWRDSIYLYNIIYNILHSPRLGQFLLK